MRAPTFSKLYLQPTEPTADSARARTRIASLVERSHVQKRDLADLLRAECGVIVPSRRPMNSRHAIYDAEKFIVSCAIRDLLDLISFVNFLLEEVDTPFIAAERWRDEIERIFRETGLPYTIDDLGVVHHYVDQEFRKSVDIVISGLEGDRWSAAKHSFLDGIKALDKEPRDNLQAVRRVFDACENVFKAEFRSARLGSKEVAKEIVPKLENMLTGTNLNAAKLYAASLGRWVDALHNFRHADGEQEPVAPNDQLTIALVSAGAGHLRWLVSLSERAK